MNKIHTYQMTIDWIGNEGKGTSNYKAYNRNHTIRGVNKNTSVEGSSDPNFLGDSTRYNPEELFLSSLAACHMLWYLHLCAVNNITVEAYTDNAKGEMEELKDGSGQFVKVILYPIAIIREENKRALALHLHHEANKMCFIANSCNFPVTHEPIINIKAK